MKTVRFDNRALWHLILPLFVEQFLLMLVGIADTFVVSYAGEAAVSGVSLVNSFHTVLLFLFTALSSGGAVIISQYTGSGDRKNAGTAASQLLMLFGWYEHGPGVPGRYLSMSAKIPQVDKISPDIIAQTAPQEYSCGAIFHMKKQAKIRPLRYGSYR